MVVLLRRLLPTLFTSIILGARVTAISHELAETQGRGNRKGLRGGEVGDKAAKEEVSVGIGEFGLSQFGGVYSYMNTLARTWREPNNMASLLANDNHDPFYPGCLLFDNAAELGQQQGCAFLRLFRRMTTNMPQVFYHPLSGEEPRNPTGDMPRPLTFDTRSSIDGPPRTLTHAEVASEMPTYYFLYRLIFRVYRFSHDYDSAKLANRADLPILPLLVEGWSQQKVYYLDYKLKPSMVGGETGGSRRTPFAVTLVKGDRMLVLFRGTVYLEEWEMDWQYKHSTDPLAAQLFPGKVHSGVFSTFKMTYAEIEQEVLRVRPSHVLVAGHSLGGVNALLHGYHIQELLGTSAARVDVVAIGAPLVGDKDFAAATGRMINQRSIVYVGSDADDVVGDFRIGDPIPQYTCGPFLGCEALGTGPDNYHWDYARQPCIIPFRSADMGNTERWGTAEHIFLGSGGLVPSMHNIASTHLCSYMCWFSQSVEDKYSLCYFKDQGEGLGLPESQLCYFPSIPL